MIPKISPCNYNINPYNGINNSYSNKNLSFTSLPCTLDGYTDVYGNHRSTQHTTTLRNDLDYDKVGKIVHEHINSVKHKNLEDKIRSYFVNTSNLDSSDTRIPKVTIYSMAGSDGTEAYAIANAIIKRIGFENAKKYVFPIKVSDVCENIIKDYGNKGRVYFLDNEIDKLKSIKPYLEPTGKIMRGDNLKEYKISQDFRNCFTFETADLQEQIEKFPKPKKNELNIVIIRNCLAQAFGAIETSILLEKIPQHLPKDSLVIFGDYDTKIKMPDVFHYRKDLYPIDTENNIYLVYPVQSVGYP